MLFFRHHKHIISWLKFVWKYSKLYHILNCWFRGYGGFTGTSRPPKQFQWYLEYRGIIRKSVDGKD